MAQVSDFGLSKIVDKSTKGAYVMTGSFVYMYVCMYVCMCTCLHARSLNVCMCSKEATLCM